MGLQSMASTLDIFEGTFLNLWKHLRLLNKIWKRLYLVNKIWKRSYLINNYGLLQNCQPTNFKTWRLHIFLFQKSGDFSLYRDILKCPEEIGTQAGFIIGRFWFICYLILTYSGVAFLALKRNKSRLCINLKL